MNLKENLQSLVGKTYSEKEFYEILLFEIEENLEQFKSLAMHFYFDSVGNNKIKISELVFFEDDTHMHQVARTEIEKRQWFQICQHYNRVDVVLCRLDRSGFVSLIDKDTTHTQDWSSAWADETPHMPMTQDEIREAFQELAGLFDNPRNQQHSRSKKAI